VDHHNPGDPGFACAPEQYVQGSSLGQVLTLLGRKPSMRQRIICAADHCPQAAYRGECPGVSPDALAKWRLADKAKLRRISLARMLELVQAQYERLAAAPRVVIAGFEVAWMGDTATGETPEASARYDIPFMYRKREHDGREKAGILGAPPHVVEAWMRECELFDVYGSPSRGYAGGYLSPAA
jgi:hypothetical protein